MKRCYTFVLFLILIFALIPLSHAEETDTMRATIQYYANGGVFRDGNTWKTEVYTGSGTTKIHASMLTGNALFRTGYRFSGWAILSSSPVDGTILELDSSWLASVTNDFYLSDGENVYAVAIWTEGGDDVPGDANGDGETDIFDALILLKYDAGLYSLSEDRIQVSDVNHDGEVDIFDALLLLRYDAGLISTFD